MKCHDFVKSLSYMFLTIGLTAEHRITQNLLRKEMTTFQSFALSLPVIADN